jgi:protein AaeX
MNAEINLLGVYVPSLILCAPIAAMAVAALGRALRSLGLDRIIWHRSLFNAAAFICLLGVVTQLLSKSSP